MGANKSFNPLHSPLPGVNSSRMRGKGEKFVSLKSFLFSPLEAVVGEEEKKLKIGKYCKS
jgi:hypothetical protein